MIESPPSTVLLGVAFWPLPAAARGCCRACSASPAPRLRCWRQAFPTPCVPYASTWARYRTRRAVSKRDAHWPCAPSPALGILAATSASPSPPRWRRIGRSAARIAPIWDSRTPRPRESGRSSWRRTFGRDSTRKRYRRRCRHPGAGLLSGRWRGAGGACLKADGAAFADVMLGKRAHAFDREIAAVLPGAFNPLHDGHRAMREDAARRLGCPVVFELSIANVGQAAPRLSGSESSPGSIRTRRGRRQQRRRRSSPRHGPSAESPSWWARTPWPGSPRRRYYDSVEARDAALAEMAALGCAFLVYGRLEGGVFRTFGGHGAAGGAGGDVHRAWPRPHFAATSPPRRCGGAHRRHTLSSPRDPSAQRATLPSLRCALGRCPSAAWTANGRLAAGRRSGKRRSSWTRSPGRTMRCTGTPHTGHGALCLPCHRHLPDGTP